MSTPLHPYGSTQNPWRREDGSIVACTEKLKVMAEGLAEFKELALATIEDGVLMGIREDQVKAALTELIASISCGYSAMS